MTLQTSALENFRLCQWEDERTVKRAQTVSEDPHLRERNLKYTLPSLGGLDCLCGVDGRWS